MNTCEYCGSGVNTNERSCIKCGAPNKNYATKNSPVSILPWDVDVRGNPGNPLMITYHHNGKIKVQFHGLKFA